MNDEEYLENENIENHGKMKILKNENIGKKLKSSKKKGKNHENLETMKMLKNENIGKWKYWKNKNIEKKWKALKIEKNMKKYTETKMKTLLCNIG